MNAGDDMQYLIGLISGATPMHQHTDYEIIIYTKGSDIFSTADKEIPVSAGKIIIVPPGVMHGAYTNSGAERIYIQGEFGGLFSLHAPVVLSDNAKNEGALLVNMILENRYANPEYVASLISAFAHFLLQSLQTDNEISGIIQDIVHKITTSFYDCNINLAGLLQKSGYAEDYIRAQFKKQTGKTPTALLTETRIHHACFLIDTYKKTLSLSEIAEKCGYTDYVYFSRRFKMIMGVSPANYIKQTSGA